MKPNGVLFNVVVAAVVAAVTAAGTSYLVLRYAPLRAKSPRKHLEALSQKTRSSCHA
jgi:hypothetical protein